MKLSGSGVVDWSAALAFLISFFVFLPVAIAGLKQIVWTEMRSRVLEVLVVKKIGKETRGNQVGEGVDVRGQGTVFGEFGGLGADGLLGLSG